MDFLVGLDCKGTRASAACSISLPSAELTPAAPGPADRARSSIFLSPEAVSLTVFLKETLLLKAKEDYFTVK